MLFETGGTLYPYIKNPYTDAVGIIQFMPKTLQAMGYNTNQVEKMSVSEQLQLTSKYLKPYHSKLLFTNDWLDFYLAVLYPKLIGKPDSDYFAKDANTKIYLQNKGLDFDKDGDIQKSDIRNFFQNKIDKIRIVRNLPIMKWNDVKGNDLLVIGILAVATIYLIT